MKLENLEVFNFKGAFRGMRNPMNSWDRSDSYFGLANFDYDNPISKLSNKWVENENKIREITGKNVFEKGTEKYYEVWSKYYDWLEGYSKLNVDSYTTELICIGPEDMKLAQRLIRSGSEHRKFLRQIIICFDLEAPLYFWKEFDTYKVGTASNSTSTMHKLASTPITLDCFETDDYEPNLIYLTGVDDSGDNMFSYQLTVRDIVESQGMNTYDEPTIIQFLEELRVKYNKTKYKKYWKELIRWLPESWLQKRTITMNYETAFNIIHQRKNHKLSEWHYLIDKFKELLPYANELLFIEEQDVKLP
jgi:hypothetical protein